MKALSYGLLRSLCVIGCLGLFIACADQSSKNDGSEISTSTGQGGKETTIPGASKTFCSYLDFSNVNWNSSFSAMEQRAFAIALSVSGVFEGPDGWKNLTNNFDGQGLSAGLLNQTLGTGSLQPLLHTMAAYDSRAFEVFAPERRDSILNMISKYVAITKISPLKPNAIMSRLSVREEEEIYSPLEINSEETMSALAGTPEQNSVSWAVANLYQSTGKFKTEWATEIKKLLSLPAYIDIQILAAEILHERAQRYMDRVGFKDLRTYLMMFDYAVLNGSIKEAVFQEWDQWVANNPMKSIEEKLKSLVEIRMRTVKPEFVKVVRERKYALIDGVGSVYGTKRNFPKQFCYSQADSPL